MNRENRWPGARVPIQAIPLVLLLAVLALMLPADSLAAYSQSNSQSASSASGNPGQAWLVTYGPGEEMWERFGHNAIWLRDESRGLDRTYSYGYFDMDRPGFAWDFARGIMIYEGAATDPAREFAWYRGRDRTVELQRLDLDEDAFVALQDRLDASLAPDEREYAYDYYYNNCSTRLRDFLDEVLDGALSDATRDRSANLNFRDHTHRLTEEQFWLHTGMMMGLGPAVDRPIAVWEEMFLPRALAREVADLEVDGRPLVADQTLWHETETFFPPDKPSHRIGLYSLLGLVTAALVALPLLAARRRVRRAGLAALVGVKAAAGGLLIFLWLSYHDASAANAFLLLLNPLWLLLFKSWAAALDRMLIAVLGLLVLAGTIVLALPEFYQFRPGPLLWIVPASLAGLAVAWQTRSGQSAD